MNNIPIGTKVVDKFDSRTIGTVVSDKFDMIGGTGYYVIRLDEGHWTEGRRMFISHIVIHESNLREVAPKTLQFKEVYG